jgi:hypothetical protein
MEITQVKYVKGINVTKKVSKKSSGTENSLWPANSDSVPTIPKEINSAKQTRNKEFYDFKEAKEYAKANPDLHLYSEDLSAKCSKRYLVADKETIYQFSTKKKFHLYETFDRGQQIKLNLDIDLKNEDIPKDVDRMAYLNTVINSAIQLMNRSLEKYKIYDPQIIILESCRSEKLSAHIIFVDVVFPDVIAIKFFMFDIESKLIKDDIIDPSIYKPGSLRMLWNSKCGKKQNLEFYKAINYTNENDHKLFMDCLVTNIPETYQFVDYKVPENIKLEKPKKKTKNQQIALMLNETIKNIKYPVELIKKYLDIIDVKTIDNYDKWIKIGAAIKNCNASDEAFKLWDDWSKRSDKYDSTNACMYKWNSFKSGPSGLGTISFYAKADNDAEVYKIENEPDKLMYDAIEFYSEYLMQIGEQLKDKKSIISNKIYEWWESETVKVLAIKSAYGTGKTVLICDIIKELNPQRILFITYRQTLTNDFLGIFGKYNVRSYLDKAFDADRVICQIESLHHLVSGCVDGKQTSIPEYDLVIIDEIESVLNHFMSTTIKGQEATFTHMYNIIFNSKKLLVLDGDFGNRSYEYIHEFGDNIILHNTAKKGNKHYVFINEREVFDKSIEKDLKDGKNVAIVSMSATIAEHFYNLYKDTYKAVSHTAKSDDSLKEHLKDVVSFWKQFQLLCYSPTIESGVSFDCEHFDKIYVIVCAFSTSPRGLMQMISRIRKVRDNETMVYLNNVPFRKTAAFYNYQEVKEHMLDHFQKYITPETVLNIDTNKMELQYKFSLYSKILVHNEQEAFTRSSSYFIAYFIKLLVEKGNTYEVKGITREKNNYNKGFITKKELAEADDINSAEYDMLFDKVKANDATREEKIQIEKYLYKQNWKIEKITEEFIYKYYGMTHILFNLRAFINEANIQLYETVEKSDINYINYNGTVKLEQIKMIKDVIKKLGLSAPFVKTDKKFIKAADDHNIMMHIELADPQEQIELDRDTFEANMDIVIKECELFNNPKKSQPLFGYNKNKIESMKGFLGFVNSVISSYGITIKRSISYEHQTKNKKRKTIEKGTYYLTYLNELNQYL